MTSKKPEEAQVWVLKRRPPFDQLEDRVEYFRDGELVVIEGIIKIPADLDHLSWARRCLMVGYAWPNDIVPDTFSKMDYEN